MKVSHFGTVVAIVLMLTSTPVWACYVTQECAQLQQSMEEFYNRAVENNRFTRSRSINLGRGQERYYFLEDDIAKFIKKNQTNMEAVLSQAEKASKEAVRLVEKFRAVSKLPESKLKELGQQIDVAVNQANELFKLIHGFGQGPNGGLVGNGILWPDNVPARFKYLNDMADKSKYMNYSTAMTLMDNYDTEMAKLVQYSREMEKVTVEHLEWLKKNAARDAARGIKSANSLELEAARIESRILPRTASSGAVAAGHAPSLWQATKTFLRSAVR